MERCRYSTHGGWRTSGKNAGETAPPLKGPELLLGWGNRKRLRCVKFSRNKPAILNAGTESTSAATKASLAPMEGRTIRFEKEPTAVALRRNSSTNYRVLRNLEGNGAVRGVGGQQRSSPPEAVNGGGVAGVSPEKGGSSSGSEGAAWPRIEITLTIQEKEEDFMAFKGTKPSLRPKKRAKPIQKSVNLMSPGAWLCDLSLERYEVREKKTSKKRPRAGLRAMGSKESDTD